MNNNRQMKIKLIFIIAVSVIALIIFGFAVSVKFEGTIEKFNNGEVLVCHRTLIVSNSDWTLSNNHLINSNSAGYINIKNCEEQKWK